MRMMREKSWLVAFTGLLALFCVRSEAQIAWGDECIDPMNMMPRSNTYSRLIVGNSLMVASLGIGGTVTYGNAMTGPCFTNPPGPAPRTMNLAGRIGLSCGPEGSVQDGDDLGMRTYLSGLTFSDGSMSYNAYDRDAGAGDGGYFNIIEPAPGEPAGQDGIGQFTFGEGGLNTFFVGASNRYIFARWIHASGFSVELTLRVLADAARFEWIIRNTSLTTVRRLGLASGYFMALMTANNGIRDHLGFSLANSSLATRTRGRTKRIVTGTADYIGWNTLPTTKPVRTDRVYLSSNPKFPNVINFQFGQSEAYGPQFINRPLPGVVEDITQVNRVVLGDYGYGREGKLLNNVMKFVTFGDDIDLRRNLNPKEEDDVEIDNMALCQLIEPEVIPPNGSRRIVQLVKSVWSASDYRFPYPVSVDAPRLISTTNGVTGVIGNPVNGLLPNPFKIRVYVDNQYAEVDREITLTNVRCTITLPSSITLEAGESRSKVISSIGPNAIAFVDFRCRADGNAFGQQNFSVLVEPVPGFSKTINSSIMVASTPKLQLGTGPNFVTIPWTFGDGSLEAVLGLVQGRDFLAYVYNPQTATYEAATSAQRGRGLWIIPTSDLGLRTLTGAQRPADTFSGGLLFALRRGWNAIGNPYNFPVPLSQLVVVAEDDPARALDFQQAVNNGFVSSSLAFWQRDPVDPNTGVYRYTQSLSDLLQPNTAYWIFVSTARNITVSWPGVFLEGAPQSGRSRAESEWQNTEDQWRARFTVSTSESRDDFSVVFSKDAAAQNNYRVLKPPTVPSSRDAAPRITAYLEDTFAETRMAHAQVVTTSRNEIQRVLKVNYEGAGEVNLALTNIGSIRSVAKNAVFKLFDPATNQTYDLTRSSVFTYRQDQPGTKEFRLILSFDGAAAAALISDFTVSQPGRGPNEPITFSWTLTRDGSASLNILGADGRLVRRLTSNRSDSAGVNQATWNLQDEGGRNIAPGSYVGELVVTTRDGERARRIIPVNVRR